MVTHCPGVFEGLGNFTALWLVTCSFLCSSISNTFSICSDKTWKIIFFCGKRLCSAAHKNLWNNCVLSLVSYVLFEVKEHVGIHTATVRHQDHSGALPILTQLSCNSSAWLQWLAKIISLHASLAQQQWNHKTEQQPDAMWGPRVSSRAFSGLAKNVFAMPSCILLGEDWSDRGGHTTKRITEAAAGHCCESSPALSCWQEYSS